MKKVLLRLLKIAGLSVGSVLALMFLWPVLFPGTASEQIKRWTNAHIDGQIQFSEARLSFFRHFPNLTLTLHDFSLTGAAPFEKDTLLAGQALSFGLNLASLFSEALEVRTFYIDDARVNVQVDEQGRANYNIYKGKPDESAPADSSNTHLKIEGVFLRRCQLVYHDRSLPMRIEAADFNYEGRGDLAHSQFDLQSKMEAARFDFVYDGTPYFLHRKLKAELLTGVNTSSLVFRFAQNNLLINQLPVDFSGDMAIVRDGYDIDLNVVSGTTDLRNILSALPPEYDHWFAQTTFGGQAQIRVAMKGKYRAATGEAPDLAVKLRLADGLIRHQQAPAPLEKVWLSATARVPGLQPDSLSLTVDTLSFALNGAPTCARLFVKGMAQPYIKAEMDASLDLGLLDQALGLSSAELKGALDLKLRADGFYRTAVKPGKPHPDTLITAIPAYHLEAALHHGHLQVQPYELPLDALEMRLRSDCRSGRWQEIALDLDTLHVTIGAGGLSGRLSAKGLPESDVSGRLLARLQLEDLARALPMQGYQLAGALDADVQAQGRLDLDRQRLPAIRGAVRLDKGQLQTPYYPQPIEQIRLDAQVDGNSGSYRDLSIHLRPLSFVFEKQPFTLNADLKNPNDLQYNISAGGTLDLGRIYQVFAVKGYGITGLLQADLEVQGTEADATAGRYDRIRHKGTLRLKNVELHSDDYPAPFFVPGSTLRFEQDKAWLSNTVLRYRQNVFSLNGYAQNFIGHALGGSTLRGQLTVESPRLVVDDFMALAPASPAPKTGPATPPPASGVVLLPADMDLELNAAVKTIAYGQTTLQDFSGQLALQKGQLNLRQTTFRIAGAPVAFEGTYTPVHARKALFTLHLKADSFDVQRAYREVPLFRDMASAAEKAQGLVSLEYRLQGRLNDRMMPVYPSINGEGFVKLEQVKVNGLKLFGAVSKATGKDEINNPELKAVVLKSSVAHNIITLERTKMKVLGFRPRIEGQVSLDGRLNLRFRLGLPPFGLLGIPMTITGTSEAPVVEIRKGKNGEELEEEADEEQ